MRSRLLGLVAIAAVTAGCSASSSGGASGPPVTPGPSRAGLVAAAHLAPCPASASTTTAGGLPDVTLPCLGDGPPVHVAGLRGMPTVVNIWGSWCEPCQHEMTYFASTYDADRSRVRFLGVDTVDSDDSALDFAAHVSPPMRFPSVVDEDKKVLLGIAADAPPVTLFVNSAGRVVGRHPGGYTSASQLHADIASYLHVS